MHHHAPPISRNSKFYNALPLVAAGRGNFSFSVNTNLASQAQKHFTYSHYTVQDVRSEISVRHAASIFTVFLLNIQRGRPKRRNKLNDLKRSREPEDRSFGITCHDNPKLVTLKQLLVSVSHPTVYGDYGIDNRGVRKRFPYVNSLKFSARLLTGTESDIWAG
jgi:hypothetical protein